jgi:hypothetical protein
MEAFDHLTNDQKGKLLERLQEKSDDNNEAGLIEQNSIEPTTCPHCASTEKPYRWGIGNLMQTILLH